MGTPVAKVPAGSTRARSRRFSSRCNRARSRFRVDPATAGIERRRNERRRTAAVAAGGRPSYFVRRPPAAAAPMGPGMGSRAYNQGAMPPGLGGGGMGGGAIYWGIC